MDNRDKARKGIYDFMKSLLIKDSYELKTLGIVAVAFGVSYAVMQVASQEVFTLSLINIPVGMFSLVAVDFPIFFDAQTKYREYESTLPYTVFEIVAVKYVEIFGIFLINLLVSVLAFKTISPEDDKLFTDYFSQFLIMPLALLAVLSIIMPIAFRFDKIAAIIGISSLILFTGLTYFTIDPPKAPQAVYTIALPAIAIAIFILSFAISYAILKRRDI